MSDFLFFHLEKHIFVSPCPTYRGAHAGLLPGLQQRVEHPVILSLRMAGVSRLTPQVCFLISTLLDFTGKIVQRIRTVRSANADKKRHELLTQIQTLAVRDIHDMLVCVILRY